MTAANIATPHTPLGDVSRAVHWVLRVSVWACFVGHGMFGIRQKAEWLAFFEPFGVPERFALVLMPLVGLIDITLGYLVLLQPRRVVVIYTAAWGIFTALLRPLIGLSFFETMERAGNYGPSLALLLGTAGLALFTRVPLYDLSIDRHYQRLKAILVLTTSMLLVGHGGLALDPKPLLVEHWASLGFASPYSGPQNLVRALGALEITAGLVLLVWPTRVLCASILGWKLYSEMLFVVSGAPVWEVVERGGSYGAPLALIALLSFKVCRPARAAPDKAPAVPATSRRMARARELGARWRAHAWTRGRAKSEALDTIN